MRLHAQTAIIENGFVHIPETAPWLAEYLLCFPRVSRNQPGARSERRSSGKSSRRHSRVTRSAPPLSKAAASACPLASVATALTGKAVSGWQATKHWHRSVFARGTAPAHADGQDS